MSKLKGLKHIYYGDGKGKTTAAFGLALRCAGRGGNVVIAQFLKGANSGEVTAVEIFDNIEVIRGKMSKKFTFQMNDEEKKETSKECLKILNNAVDAAIKNKAKLLVLDEVIDACSTNMISNQDLIDAIQSTPEELEIVMTGHSLPEFLIDITEYITKMQKEKHPYDQGITARKYIEF